LRIEAIPMNIYYARQKDVGQLDIAKFDSRLKFCGDEGKVSPFFVEIFNWFGLCGTNS